MSVFPAEYRTLREWLEATASDNRLLSTEQLKKLKAEIEKLLLDRDAKAGDDLIWGAQAIADELGIPLHRVYYLIRTRRIPVTRLGAKTLICSRKRLQRALSQQVET
jgi:hypothetical protein